MTVPATVKKGDAYFLSHGGPNSISEPKTGAYKGWKDFGRIVTEAQPKGLVIVSAHWENVGREGVLVNSDSSNPLIYDFYGFPKHFYELKFESHGDPVLLKAVVSALEKAGIPVATEKRGLDHGVWGPFLAAFDGKTDIPIIQVSLPGDSSPVTTAKLGKALAPLRDEGYAVVGSGQVVHNLRDVFGRGGDTSGYAPQYMQASIDAAASSKPLEAAMTLFRHPLYKRAHPTPEHLLPLLISTAAVDEGDELETIYAEYSKDNLGWADWRWKSQTA
ncbi:Extradiol ring-cleavage dioxygenase, class III enzyme, subunit B [Naematelia encephala]|uniref:Extradiol ring-cleavage dioxygenase, class III enzyme, subunit B n=1 Tax=Naematelia encephala TaxID=71784 RepID=A0A1Y2BFF3_9TREE|nr:Extradiol ring-cleavage dioxygenase, class III enzyme, subunit B [Naematelia encephala]